MTAPPTLPLAEIQRIVLRDAPVGHVCHLVLEFTGEAGACEFIRGLQHVSPVSFGNDDVDATQVLTSVGFTYRGLERLHLPPAALAPFLTRAPAFVVGAPLRGSAELGDTGPSAALYWKQCFQLEHAHGLITLHAEAPRQLVKRRRLLRQWARHCGVTVFAIEGQDIGAPPPESGKPENEGQWIHFGFRDGLSKIRVQGWPEPSPPHPAGLPEHAPGEFLLGHLNDHGFNPWVLPQADRDVRTFVQHGSFGVLRMMEQDVAGFEAWVAKEAGKLKDGWLQERSLECPEQADEWWADYVKAKLCGRWPNGGRITANRDGVQACPKDLTAYYDYTDDPQGQRCPIGAHVRRMNPRLPLPGTAPPTDDDGPVHARQRPLIRRGRPYGPRWWGQEKTSFQPRGLLGLFFCASLEDQFEHLLGQWAERSPLGSNDPGGSKDPFIGQHEAGTRFHIPGGSPSGIELQGLRPFVKTRGTLYAFHPSASALCLIGDSGRFPMLEESPIEP